MKDREPILLNDIVSDTDNKYQVIVKIATKIKEQFELTGERDETLIIKTLEEATHPKTPVPSSARNVSEQKKAKIIMPGDL